MRESSTATETAVGLCYEYYVSWWVTQNFIKYFVAFSGACDAVGPWTYIYMQILVHGRSVQVFIFFSVVAFVGNGSIRATIFTCHLTRRLDYLNHGPVYRSMTYRSMIIGP